jgi:outer membrane protein OmpA-like peptidoglycan-associated protein
LKLLIYMANILDNLARMITPTLIGTVEKQLGKSTSGTESALGETSPSILEGTGFLKRLLPLLLIGALTWFGLQSCGTEGVESSIENAGDTMSDVTGKANSATGDLANDAAAMRSNALSDLKETANGLWALVLPDGATIEANKDGLEYSLINFIKSDNTIDKATRLNFDALRFKTKSDNLDSDFSKRQIDNMVSVLNAYPDVHLNISGYTDNVGDRVTNAHLSENRAHQVAVSLVTKGIDRSRLTVEGLGETHPACPANDTPECQAQNRRITALVTKK